MNRVKMKGYSIKTHSGPSDVGCHTKTWVVEGKNEGEEWEEIDRRDNYDLNGPLQEHYYLNQEMTKPYQYFRIKSIGKDHYAFSRNYGCYHLTLNQFEIYGEIYEEG